MKTQAVVVADDPVYMNWLQNCAPGAEFTLVRPHDAEDLIQRVQVLGRVDMVFFQVDAASVATRAGWIEHLLDRMPEVPAAAVGAEQNPDVVLAAMRAGARDFFVLRKDEANVAASLGRLLRRNAQVTRGNAVKGKLYTVMSAHPHEGIAFLAQHLALAFVQSAPKGERVLLVDVATPAGAGTIFLNMNQPYTVLDAVNDVHRCDQTLVDTAFPKHASGLYALSLPEDFIGRPQLNHEELQKLLQVLRGLFPVIVVSVDGHVPLSGIKPLIAQSDRSLVMTDQSIIKSRHSKYLLRALRLEECPLDRTALLVTCYPRRPGLEPQNLAALLDLPLFGTLGGERMNHIQAMNSGEPIFTAAPRDAYCSEVRALASALMSDRPQSEPAQQGLLSRLLS